MMEELRDIKGLVVISDFSWVILLMSILCMAGILGLLVWKIVRKKKVLTPKEEALLFLQTLSLEDAKVCAYALSQFGSFLVEDTNKVVFELLQKKLHYYKYRSCNAPLSEEEKALWQQFLGKNDADI